MVEENVEQEITYHRFHRDRHTTRERGGDRDREIERERETETDRERDRDRWFIVNVTDPYSRVEVGGRFRTMFDDSMTDVHCSSGSVYFHDFTFYNHEHNIHHVNVPPVEFMYPLFTRMAGESFTVGDSGLCCCCVCVTAFER